MSVLELNIATGLRAKLESTKNASLTTSGGAAIASFLNLQNKLSTLTEELTLEKKKHKLQQQNQMNQKKKKKKKIKIKIKIKIKKKIKKNQKKK